jgi:phosphohistidine phosphatase
MGAWIAENDLVPDLVVCSTARRTRETLSQLQPVLEEKLGRALPVGFDAAVYEATTARLLTVIRRTPGTPRRLMLIGHNPGFEVLAHDLKRDADAVAAERLGRKYSTCGLAVLDLPIDAWAQTTPRSARLTHFMAPRYLS